MDQKHTINSNGSSNSKNRNCLLVVLAILGFIAGFYYPTIRQSINELLLREIDVERQIPKTWQTYTLPQYQLQFKAPYKPNRYMNLSNGGLIWNFIDSLSENPTLGRIDVLVMKNNNNLTLEQLLTTKLHRSLQIEEKLDVRKVKYNSLPAYFYKTRSETTQGAKGKYTHIYSEKENLAFIYNKRIYIFSLEHLATIGSQTLEKPDDEQVANIRASFNDRIFEQLLGSIILSGDDPRFAELTPTPTPTLVPKVFQQIVRIDANRVDKTVVKSEYDEVSDRKLIKVNQWENFLIIYEVETNRIRQTKNSYKTSKRLYIRTHELKTGMEYNIGTINADRFDHVYDKVIGDKLYISLPAFTDEYGLYSVRLPPVDKIFRVTDKGNISRITLIDQNYYLVGGIGDSCFSNTSYNLFHPESNSVYPVFNHFNGCGYGSYIFDFEDSGTVLMADRVEENPDPFQYLGKFYGIFKNVYRIDPRKPDFKDILISSDQMPINARFAEFYKKINKLIIYGDGIYEYDLASKSLNHIVSPPEEGLLGFSVVNYENDLVCASYFKISGDIQKDQNAEPKDNYVLIDTKDKTLKKSLKPCKYPKEAYKYSNDDPHDINKQVEKLKLPVNYKVIYH